jgi:ABC-type uncharacterized transport system involved in gliding motility auxiliary subunit
MRRYIDLLAPLGVLVMAGAFVLERLGKKLPGNSEIYVIVGACLILSNILLRFEDISRTVGARQLRYGSNSLVFSLVVLGILVLLNWFVVRHSKRWDLTKNQRYSLSDQAKKVIQNLKEDVNITYFCGQDEMSAAKERMKAFEGFPHIKVSYVVPNKDPMRAQALDITQVPTVVFERGTHREKATNDSEQDVENALIKVTRDSKKVVCFVEGEGEHDIEDTRGPGYSKVKEELTASQYEAKKVALFRESKVPAECTVLVVSGPAKDALPPVVDQIREFVKGGGRALIMLDPELKESYPNLTGLLKEWNIEAARDIVIDVSPLGQTVGSGPIAPICIEYPYHEITKDFHNQMTIFDRARSMEAGKGTVPGITAQNLVETSSQSWAETDLTLKSPVQYDEGKDRKGPISLAAVSTISTPGAKPEAKPEAKPGDEGESTPSKSQGRVVAFGDSDFADNRILGLMFNRDLFMNSVAWLAQDSELISIRAREPDDQRMTLNGNQQLLVLLVALLLIPGSFVVMGIASWLRRR